MKKKIDFSENSRPRRVFKSVNQCI